MKDFYISEERAKLFKKLDQTLFDFGSDMRPEEIVSIILFWVFNVTYDICPNKRIADENIHLILGHVSSIRFGSKGLISYPDNNLN